jgi:hypothetical protein
MYINKPTVSSRNSRHTWRSEVAHQLRITVDIRPNTEERENLTKGFFKLKAYKN